MVDLSIDNADCAPTTTAPYTITLTVAPPAAPATPTPGVVTQPPFTVVSLGGPGSPDVHIPVLGWMGSTITLAVPVQGTYGAGQTSVFWFPPAIPGDHISSRSSSKSVMRRFPIRVRSPRRSLPAAPAGGFINPYETLPLPVLLDASGGPILYFPKYNGYSNHVTTIKSMNTGRNPALSPISATAVVSVGPIFGSPSSNPAVYQYNTALTNTGTFTGPSIFWSGPFGSWGGNPASASTPLTTGQIEAILFKLGDQTTTSTVNATNAILTGETFTAGESQYFLVSPGPDGAFEDLAADLSSNPSQSASYLMSKSDDIYSFDH